MHHMLIKFFVFILLGICSTAVISIYIYIYIGPTKKKMNKK